MSDPFDPREVLTAVQRLELDLDDIRARARRAPTPEMGNLRDELMAAAAVERAKTVEDMASVLDVVEASWRASDRAHQSLSADIYRLGARLNDLQADIARLHDIIASARVEVTFAPSAEASHTAGPHLNGAPTPTPGG